MGAIYRRYHERHRQLRAQRAAADLAIADKQLLAELQDRLGLQLVAAADPAPPPPEPLPVQLPAQDAQVPPPPRIPSEHTGPEPAVDRRKPKRTS